MWFTTAEGENVFNKLLIVDGCLQLSKVQNLGNISPILFLLLLDGSMFFFPLTLVLTFFVLVKCWAFCSSFPVITVEHLLSLFSKMWHTWSDYECLILWRNLNSTVLTWWITFTVNFEEFKKQWQRASFCNSNIQLKFNLYKFMNFCTLSVLLL